MTSTTHAPYIMPDGSRLSHYLSADEDPAPRRPKNAKRGGGGGSSFSGRANVWAQIEAARRRHHQQQQHHHHAAGEDPELAALERAGRARARRMINERTLRDLADADALTADDMRALFSPAPFGGPVRPGPFAAVTGRGAGNSGAVGAWEAFRSIDSDRQERLLAAWAAAAAAVRQEERAQRRAAAHAVAQERRRAAGGEQVDDGAAAGVPGADEASRRRATRASAAASAALASWARVPRGARSALRKANVHAVLDLEAGMLALLEESARAVAAAEVAGGGAAAGEAGGAAAAAAGAAASAAAPEGLVVVANGADGFGRLLAHGLAAFHGLASASCDAPPDEGAGSGRGVSVWRAPTLASLPPAAAAAAAAAAAGPSREGAAAHSLAALARGTGDGATAVEELVTCTDLLMAMQEGGAYLTAAGVARYARAHLLSGATTPTR